MSYPTFLTAVEREIREERDRQDAKFGPQNHLDGTGRDGDAVAATQARKACQANSPADGNWRDILEEEVREAFAETDPELLRTELIQVAAVCQNWVEAIDRRAVLAHPTDNEATTS
jgi:hypothetical protein